jgi:hypothetical protein
MPRQRWSPKVVNKELRAEPIFVTGSVCGHLSVRSGWSSCVTGSDMEEATVSSLGGLPLIGFQRSRLVGENERARYEFETCDVLLCICGNSSPSNTDQR